MSNRELYKKTFSQLHASCGKVTEVIEMNETSKKRKLMSKRLVAVAACVACIASAGIVANAATGGELGSTIMGWLIVDGEKTAIEGEVSVDENGNKTTTATLDNGDKLTKTEDSETGLSFYEYSVNEDEAENKSFMITEDKSGTIVEYDIDVPKEEIVDSEDSEDSESSDVSESSDAKTITDYSTYTEE